MNIPIQNIYYLLCYAWNKLDEGERVGVEAEDFKELIDLFAKILINGTRILLKRGIEKNYVSETIELPGIKGKIECSQTLKSNLHYKQRTVCTIDTFSGNILTNQILLSTIRRLLRTRGLDADLKAQLKTISWMFPDIEVIELNHKFFNQVRIHRNNKFYEFLIDVCHIIYENSLPTENPGEWKFIDFTRDENKMNKLFEAFIRNFYKRECPQWSVGSEVLRWQFNAPDENHLQYIPAMITDISIDTPTEKIIIDAKYYKETLTSNYDREKIKSGNLYQLFSYLMNQRDGSKKTETARGILLYPSIEAEYDLHYLYQQHKIQIKTLNLNQHWKGIESRLFSILND